MHYNSHNVDGAPIARGTCLVREALETPGLFEGIKIIVNGPADSLHPEQYAWDSYEAKWKKIGL